MPCQKAYTAQRLHNSESSTPRMQDANTRTLDQGEGTADNATHASNSTEGAEIPNPFKRHLSDSGTISSVLCSDAERITKIHSPQQPPPAAYCTGRVYNLDNNTAASPFPITKPLPSKDYQNRISTAIQNARMLPCAITAALLVPCVSTALTLLGGVAIRLSRIPGPRGVPIGKTFAVALAAGMVLGVLCGMAVLFVMWRARRTRRRTGGMEFQAAAGHKNNSDRGCGGAKAVWEDTCRTPKSVV